MKMKEQNAYLAAVGFLQVIVVAAAGGFVSELLKAVGNRIVLVSSFTIGSVALLGVIAIYAKVFVEVRKRKK